MNEYYLRIDNENFGFLVEGIHEILETDYKVHEEEYNKFFELQSEGKQFRVKDVATAETLFDLIEEYIPEVDTTPQPPTEIELLQEEVLNQSEMMLDMDFRLTSVELGL